MIEFDLLTIDRCPAGFEILFKVPTPADLPSNTLLVAINNNYVIFGLANSKMPNKTHQLVMPLAGLHWCVVTMAISFFDAPGQDDFADGQLGSRGGPFDGEIVKVFRLGAALPGGAPPGVTMSNSTRKLKPNRPYPTSVTFLDGQLFTEGVWDMLCDVVDHWLTAEGQPVLNHDIRHARPHSFR